MFGIFGIVEEEESRRSQNTAVSLKNIYVQ